MEGKCIRNKNKSYNTRGYETPKYLPTVGLQQKKGGSKHKKRFNKSVSHLRQKIRAKVAFAMSTMKSSLFKR